MNSPFVPQILSSNLASTWRMSSVVLILRDSSECTISHRIVETHLKNSDRQLNTRVAISGQLLFRRLKQEAFNSSSTPCMCGSGHPLNAFEFAIFASDEYCTGGLSCAHRVSSLIARWVTSGIIPIRACSDNVKTSRPALYTTDTNSLCTVLISCKLHNIRCVCFASL